MSCLLPHICVFCQHYLENDPERECLAFQEIPDDIMAGNCDHGDPYPDDGGYRFQLQPEELETFLELNDLRREMGLLEFRLPSP